MKNKKKEILLIVAILIIQTIVYIICGINKSYIHMDEAYSLGLASYDKVEIQDNEDFYDTWHGKDYYEDYLSVQDDEVGEYKQVYENQKNDVHPPLYYLLLRIAMGQTKGHYNKWAGITVNIIIYVFVTIITYLILKKLIGETDDEEVNMKALILTFVTSITMASLTTVIYIRMYALSALNILITTYLHMKLLESKKPSYKLLTLIGISALAGSLTHYYYLFYLAMLYLIFVVKYVKEKEYKSLIKYTITMVIAAVASLAIFPYSIVHMFFGYRGQGVMSKLTDVPQFITDIAGYLEKVNRFGFNNLLYLIILAIIGILLYKKNKDTEKIKENKYMKLISYPTAFYFILVAIASPWIELRYIMPICGLIFILVIYYLYQLIKTICEKRESNVIIGIVLLAILVAPIIFRIEPEVAFTDKKEIVEKLGNELNLPTLYLFNSGCNRFLDDILLFAKIDESYVAKDIEYTEENIKNILKDKDISKGIIIFINEDQENDDILDVVKGATGLENCEYLKRLNACDLYYLK